MKDSATLRLRSSRPRLFVNASSAAEARGAAILAVQQDQVWMGGEPLLPLAGDTVDALRRALDVMTLSARA